MECCSVSSFMLNHEYELQLMQLRTSFFFFFMPLGLCRISGKNENWDINRGGYSIIICSE